MAIFTLKFANDPHGPAKNIEFDATDAGAALVIAQKEAPERRAELWEGRQKLCAISRTATGIWQVDPP